MAQAPFFCAQRTGWMAVTSPASSAMRAQSHSPGRASLRTISADRADIRSHDIAERPSALENVYDQSFSNPPFFDPAAVRAPAPGKTAAYLAETPLKAWVLFLHHITKPGGRITMIHRAAALADLLELLNPRMGEIEVLPIRPTPGAAAGRVLIRGRKGLRRGPVALYDGLALHDVAGGPFSRRAAACFEGGALDWR